MDPNPIKHVGSLIKVVRERVEPTLHAAGYTFVDRNKPAHPGEPAWLDYQRGDAIFSLRYEPHAARLVGESLTAAGILGCVVTDLNQPRSADDLEARIHAFVADVGVLATAPPNA